MATMQAVIETRVKELQKLIMTNFIDLEPWEVRHADFKAFGEYEYTDDWSELKIGDIWARTGQTAFIKKQIQIPEDWKGSYVALDIMSGGEGLLSINGEPFHGVDDNRGYVRLFESAQGGEILNLEIEIKTGGYWEYEASDEKTKPYIWSVCKLMAINKDIENAYYDFAVPCETIKYSEDKLVQKAVLDALYECFCMVDFRNKKSDVDKFVSELKLASSALKEKFSAIDWHKEIGHIFYTGNSHIDVAWLWPLKETERKVGRTYNTLIQLMDEYPEYHFDCSQVPLFKYLEKNYPETFAKVVERVKEGRFEPIGGTWVENDTNLVSGESLVRQCLYGQRYFKNKLGCDVKVGWLPDVFGYTYSLPQIYKKSGLDYFMTTKLSWNDTNKFPYQVFNWEGIDGSKVLTYLSSCYVDSMDMKSHWEWYRMYKDQLVCSDYLAPFGWGDGGGGPTRMALDKIRRLDNVPGFPKAVQGRVHDFFENVVAKSKNVPTYNGELYFEYHRGVYTSQANNKKFNRKSELLQRDAELLSVIVEDYGVEYPKEQLVENWETILLNQFHDIIPGSSVNEVYKVSFEQYQQVMNSAKSVINNALSVIASKADTSGAGTPVLIFNTLSHERSDVVELDWSGSKKVTVYDMDGNPIPSQVEDNKIVFITDVLPPLGYTVYYVKEGSINFESELAAKDNSIVTPFYNIELNVDGTIGRIWDIECERDVLPKGSRGNVLQLFEDKPTDYDAWELETTYKDRAWEFECVEAPKVVYAGDVRIVVRTKYAYNKSTVSQDMIVYANKETIDFKTTVDWHEENTLFKTAFPIDVRSSKATYEIAYGNIERSTTDNTSIEQAQFEVPGHRWADLSETDYGVSILNESKFGWDIKGNTMRLTLLRSPKWPDKEADMGVHEFTYSLYPHDTNLLMDTICLAHGLNSPLYTILTDNHKGDAPADAFAEVDTSNVIIDCVKQAEDDKDVIVRVYEPYGSRGNVIIGFNKEIVSIKETNLLEAEIAAEDLKVEEDSIAFYIKPYELRTFKITFLK